MRFSPKTVGTSAAVTTVLAFDTSTEAMSIALGRGEQVWEHTGAGGAQASATLIPAIEALMAEAGLAYAQLDAIAFGRGPGLLRSAGAGLRRRYPGAAD
jgi:tRNA A37 threonylcarbamoyltransferase TsaD